MTLRIGSLFTGTGALDLAVQAVFGGEIVWHCQYEPPDKDGREDKNQYAAKILARHWPTVPNLWDITTVCWQCVIEEHGRPDILTGGFPCTDVSSAGKRAGLNPDTRSGLWSHMARAVHILQPRLVIIENVEGLLSAPAARGMGPGAAALDESEQSAGVLRALGAVLGDLAVLGFHAEWQVVAASAVGAPHRRKRIIIYAWPAAADTEAADQGRLRCGGGSAEPAGRPEPGHRNQPAADAAHLGHERCREARRRGHGPADGGVTVAHSERFGLQGVRGNAGQDAGREASPAVGCGSTGSREVAAHADGRGREGHQERDRGPQQGQPEREPGLDAVGRGVRGGAAESVCPTCLCPKSDHDAEGFCTGCLHCTDPQLGQPSLCPEDCPVCADEAAADATGNPRRIGDRDDVRPRRGADGRESTAGRGAAAHADDLGRRADVLELRPGQPDLDWGDYEAAIRRWERILGRPAPWPTDTAGRLSPVFTEWLMGLPDGWVTNTPGLTRAAMLRALGNGVVPQQAVAAIHALHQRAISDPQDPAETWAA